MKNINLRIKSDCTITVSANSSVSQKTIDDFIIKKSEFIFMHLDKFQERQKNAPVQKDFVSGESFYLLGKELCLKVIESKEEKVYSDGVFLCL